MGALKGFLVGCVLSWSTTASAAEWIRVDTPNFIVYGESGERRVREIAAEFERFREAMARVIPDAAMPAAVPTVVVMFDSERSFQPYVPRFNGKPIKLGGYFYANEDMNVVAFADGNRDESLRTIFHEYAHLVIDNIAPGMPLWVNEGLAEYYSTFELNRDGRRAVIGRPIIPHLQLLLEHRPLPMAELLAIDRTSSGYNEGLRQTLFYAQSWGIVHMLVSGTRNQSALLGQYTRLVADGVPSPDAWQQVFGDRNMTRELERYASNEVLKAVMFRFDRELPTVRGAASKVSPGDIQAVLADLLRRVAPKGEAVARFESAIGITPASARARALYALMLINDAHVDRARRFLLEAAKDTSDWLVQYHVATGLTRIVTASDADDAEAAGVARAALARAEAARPDLAHVHALSARLDSAEEDERPSALPSIRRARAVSPGREDYILLESFILMRGGELSAARRLVEPLTTARFAASVRDSAQAVLAQIAALERANDAYVARLEGRTIGSGSTARPSGRTVPTYRRLQPGEQRLEGLLERIDCISSGIALDVQVEGKSERFAVASMESIAFITHREDLQEIVACAPRTPPDRVFVTWRADADVPGGRRAVAVEFLPGR